MAYRFSKINFEQWHKNSRIKVAFFFAFIICLMLTKSVLSFADSYGTSMQILEGFIWIMGNAKSIFFVMIPLIFLLSDTPFMYELTPLCILKGNRKVWMGGQILYILCTTIIYMLFLMVSMCLMCIHISFIGNVWSQTSAYIGYSGIGEKIAIPASVKAMETATPYSCFIQIFLLVTLYAMVIGVAMLFFSLSKNGEVGAWFGIGINLLGVLLSPQMFQTILQLPDGVFYKANLLFGWISPLNHATFYMHNFGYDYLPRIWMSCTLFIIIVLLFILGINRRIKKYEFSFVKISE